MPTQGGQRCNSIISIALFFPLGVFRRYQTCTRAQVFGGRGLGMFHTVAEDAEHLIHGARLKAPKTSKGAQRQKSQCTFQGVHFHVTLVT